MSNLDRTKDNAPDGPHYPLQMGRGGALNFPRPLLNGNQIMARDFYHGFMLGRPILSQTPPTMLPGQYPRPSGSINHGGQVLVNSNMDLSYWSGPMIFPSPDLDAESRKIAMAQLGHFLSVLRKGFDPRNFPEECVTRHVRAVVGKDPEWQMENLKEGDRKWAKKWWKRSKAHASLIAAFDQAKTESRAVLKLDVLDGENAAERPMTPDRLHRCMKLLPVPPEDVYFGTDYKADPFAIVFLDGENAEIHCLDEKGRTVVRTFDAEGVPVEITLDLGGKLLVREIILPAIPTESFLADNRGYNVAKTMMNRNTELAGVVERYAVNLEPPMVTGRDGNPKPLLQVGGGSMTAWFSRVTDAEQADGSIKPIALPNPTYGRFEPTSAEPIEAALGRAEFDLLNSAKQVHVMESGSKNPNSGRSREVSAGDFMTSLDPTVREAQDTAEWALEAALGVMGYFASRSDLQDPEVSVIARVQVVPPTVAQRAQMLAEAQNKIISVSYYRAQVGILDSDHMTRQVEQDIEDGISPSIAPMPTGGTGAPPGSKNPLPVDSIKQQDPNVNAEKARNDGQKPTDANGG